MRAVGPSVNVTPAAGSTDAGTGTTSPKVVEVTAQYRSPVPRPLLITSRNARFQQWRALLDNRAKRHRAGEFLVHGVRPITLALRHGWPVRALIRADGAASSWVRETVASFAGTQVVMAPPLVAELGGKDTELVAVVALPPDDLGRIPTGGTPLVVVFDRPASPGNIGMLIRSADAFGATGVIVTGHAADPYDPQAVRASTGSIFALPVVRSGAPREVLTWASSWGAGVVGTDEAGPADVADAALSGPVLLLVGNETHGLSVAWRDAADQLVRIPMTGSASSLNAAAAATVVLYEAARQRAAVTRVQQSDNRLPLAAPTATTGG